MSIGPGLFQGDAFSQWADFQFSFAGTPQLLHEDGSAAVTLAGEDLWVSPGDPVVPVREATLLLPQGMRISDVEITFLDAGAVVGCGVQLTALPAALPVGEPAPEDLTPSLAETSFPGSEAVQFTNYSLAGYSLGQLRIFPVGYDAQADTLTYHGALSVRVIVSAGDDAGAVDLRPSPADRERVAELIDNPRALDLYPIDESGIRTATSYEYLVITSAALAGGFQPLIDRKIEEGLTAAVFTTEYIASHYAGTENGDLADRIRQFLAQAYSDWGTQWVLLGGDSEVIPQRGVYVAVGSTVDNTLPTDLYYACLDGSWNRDGDSLWGEATDGAGGGDIDLMPELFIGRAPASNLTEVGNFVQKTLLYATAPHPNSQSALWLGEQLDASTQGSYSGIPISEATIPEYWDLTELYDSTAAWSGSDLVAQLNASPNLVNHLGHANETYNARITNSTVAALVNAHPYFMYSQGCNSGSFDTHNLSIAEQHVVGAHGAVGVVMNARYGWYSPGSTPSASHHYAMQFWDAVFNEGKVRLGEANHDSKVDNLFRVTTTGVYRWIHFETNLFGDPHTALQLGAPPADPTGAIQGAVLNGQDGAGLAGQTVYLDANGNGLYDEAMLVHASSSQVLAILDHTTIRSTIEVTGAAAMLADVNLSLEITHTYDSDLEAYLISPGGTRILLFSGVGGWEDGFHGTTFDDEASLPIQSGQAPFTGSFRPTDLLSRLDGEDPNGLWTLEIRDRYSQDLGTLDGWSLTLVSTEQAVTTDAEGRYAFSTMEDGAYCVGWADDFDWRLAPGAEGVHTAEIAGGAVLSAVDFLIEPDSSVPEADDLGAVAVTTVTGMDLAAGERWYRWEAVHDGILSAQLFFAGQDSLVTLYDVDLHELGSSIDAAGTQRLDGEVVAGRMYYLRVAGETSSAGMRLVNLVDRDGDAVHVFGTEGDDSLLFQAGTTCWLAYHGVQYTFESAGTLAFFFDGGAGIDAAFLGGSDGSDVGVLRPGSGFLGGAGYQIVAEGIESLEVHGGDGDDLVRIYDSAGDDLLFADSEEVVLISGDVYCCASGFEAANIFATAGGNDTAELTGSAGDDTLIAGPDYVKLYGDGYFLRLIGFDEVNASAGDAGIDVAIFFDSSGSDVFTGRPASAELVAPAFVHRATGFDETYALSRNGGNDVAEFHDSAGDDALNTTPRTARFVGEGFFHRVQNFRTVRAFASAGGNDVARLYDSVGDDTLLADEREAWLSGRNYAVEVHGFGGIHAFATLGRDTATLCGSTDDDTYIGRTGESRMYAAGYFLRAKLFDAVYANAGFGGYDTATLFGSAWIDTLEAESNWANLSNEAGAMWAYDFHTVLAASSGSGDRVLLGAIDFLLETAGTWV